MALGEPGLGTYGYTLQAGRIGAVIMPWRNRFWRASGLRFGVVVVGYLRTWR